MPSLFRAAARIAQVLCLAAGGLSFAAPAQALTTVKDILEHYSAVGAFAKNCARPASPQNPYYVYRMIDANNAQLDGMDGPASRFFVVMLDRAKVVKYDQFSVGGKMHHNNKPAVGLMQIDARRMRLLYAKIGDAEIVHTPWLTRCER